MFNQVSSIYRNRSNAHTLKRKIDMELELTQKESAKELIEIEKKLDSYKPKKQRTSINDFVHYKNQKRTLDTLTKEKEQIKCQYVQMQEITKQLKPDYVASVVILVNNSKQNSKELFTIDPYRCSKCCHLYQFDPIRHLNICPNKRCGTIKRVLLVVEDKQTEIISFKNQELPLLIQKDAEDALVVANNLKKQQSKQRGSIDRVKAYREYLMQFEEHAKVTPDAVKMILYLEFNHIHMLNSLKCRPSAVSAILNEQEPEISIFQSCAIRITKEFNGEPIPILTLAIINNLCNRFLEVSSAAATLRNFGKLPSFEILTHLFLRTENRDDLAVLFATHKTSDVLRSGDAKMTELIEFCREHGKKDTNLLDWNRVPRAG